MLRSAYEMLGYELKSGEETFGKVRDFLFDHDQWTIRWLVADTGTWLPDRKVLISPIALDEPLWDQRVFPVHMSREQIENAPGLDTDAPVSRQYEKHWFDEFGWPYYWAPGGTVGGAGVWAGALQPQAALMMQQRENKEMDTTPETDEEVVRSVSEVRGYHFQAADSDCGHVDDFIVDDESWTLRYMVVDTRNWLPGRKVLVAPDWIKSITWVDRQVICELTKNDIEGSPEYNPSEPVNRAYEQQLYDYYGRPVYWS